MKAFLVPIVLIATSFFYFPFYFTFLPTVNTKMMMAALGLVVLLVKLGRDGHGYVSKDFFYAFTLCCGSLTCKSVGNDS